VLVVVVVMAAAAVVVEVDVEAVVVLLTGVPFGWLSGWLSGWLVMVGTTWHAFVQVWAAYSHASCLWCFFWSGWH
jgi:hypothetical protein